MLTPMEIHNHEFKKGFRGYNENEVDDFLDQIVNDYEKVLRENDQLKNQLSLCEKELLHHKEMEGSLQETINIARKTSEDVIATAQKTADEIVFNAKKSAKDMRDSALRDTQSIYDNTMKEAQNIREKAKLDARQGLDETARKLHTILDEYEKIVREKSSFLMKIRTTLESELGLTAQLLSAIPNVDELAHLRTVLSKIEAENEIYSAEVATAITENIEADKKKSADSDKKTLLEKVTKVVEHAEPIEQTDKDLEKTATYAPVKK